MLEQARVSRCQDLLFRIRRSVRYHTRRRRFFDRFRRSITFLTVLSAIATFAIVQAQLGEPWVLVTSGLLVFLGTIDLIVDSAEGARLHADLGRRLIELEMDIVLAGENLSDMQMREFANRRLRVDMEEPPIMRVLDCLCHNELVRSMGHGTEYEVKVTRLQRLFANVLDICPGEIRTASAPETVAVISTSDRGSRTGLPLSVERQAPT